MSCWGIQIKSKVRWIKPFVIHTPADAIAKGFFISPTLIVDEFLDGKAEAPIAVFHPKLIDGTKVSTRKLVYFFAFEAVLFFSMKYLQHEIQSFSISLLPLPLC